MSLQKYALEAWKDAETLPVTLKRNISDIIMRAVQKEKNLPLTLRNILQLDFSKKELYHCNGF